MLDINKIESTSRGRYELRFGDLTQLLDYAKSDGLFNAISLAYNYGFMRGQNSIKNQRKRKALAATANSNQGTPKQKN